MNGMQMMLKTFGIELDPEEIKGQVVKFQADLAATLLNFDNRLKLIETRLSTIEQNGVVILTTLQYVIGRLEEETRPAGTGPTEAAVTEALKTEVKDDGRRTDN